MSGFSEIPGQGPIDPGSNPEHLEGFEADAAPLPHSAADPGRTLGIIGLVLAFFFNIIGAIVSIIAYNQSKKAGFSNGFAVAGIVVGFVLFVVGGIFTMLFLATGFGLIANTR